MHSALFTPRAPFVPMVVRPQLQVSPNKHIQWVRHALVEIGQPSNLLFAAMHQARTLCDRHGGRTKPVVFTINPEAMREAGYRPEESKTLSKLYPGQVIYSLGL